MKNKINLLIIVSLILLFFLILLFQIISKRGLSSKNQDKQIPTIRTLPQIYGNIENQGNTSPLSKTSSVTPPFVIPTLSEKEKSISLEQTGAIEEIPEDIKKDAEKSFELMEKLPFENEKFKIDYDYKLDKFVVYLKDKNTPKEIFYQWLNKNYPDIQKERFVFADEVENIKQKLTTPTNTDSQMGEINNTFSFLRFIGELIDEALPKTSDYNSTNSPRISDNQLGVNPNPPTAINNYIFYSQLCNGTNPQYCKTPLPGGCTLETSGCGPTTTTLIIANLINKNITPMDIVKEYSVYDISCSGSTIISNKRVIEKYGLRTGNILALNNQTIDKVIDTLKNYIQNGATLFVLGRFKYKDRLIGHYFWIVDIDQQNNVWSLDPAWGSWSIPYNQNSRYPYPLYTAIFPIYRN